MALGPDSVADAVALDGRESAGEGAMPDVRALYARYGNSVYRWALRYGGGSSAWAEDVTHDVFVGLLTRPPALAEHADLDGWFYRITANRCLNQLRRDRFLRSSPFRWMLGRERSGPPTPEAQVCARSELSDAMAAVSTLPPKQRIAFLMHRLDGKQQHEIAGVLGHSKSYVCKLLQKAETALDAMGWRLDHE